MDTKAKNKRPSAIQPGMILSLVLCVGLGAGVAYALPENESFFAVFLFGLAGFCVSFALQTILQPGRMAVMYIDPDGTADLPDTDDEAELED